MRDPSWAVSAFLTFAFFVAALADVAGQALGWWLLTIGMVVVTVIRFRSSTPDDGDGPPGG